ncbi:MAG: hypothetical protein IKU15_00635 [Clostridia bacterium]|nr:hypothetical protein [Clostridia bacterium]MBR4889807.1 hypothetical protein [Clostridia bacterium]
MIENLKTKIYQALVDKGYYITDAANYEEKFPWLLLRLSNMQKAYSLNIEYSLVDFTIDVFSQYNGEKEILQLEKNITNTINKLMQKEPSVMGVALKNCRIIDDKSTGPVAKHGILTYQFILTVDKEDEADE